MTQLTDSLHTLNIADVWTCTRTLGPGLRSAVWVQGCPRHCPNCISPDWIPQIEARRIGPEDLASIMLKSPDITGLTFSGGEPMLQASGLSVLAKIARIERDLNIICFTGYTYQQLLNHPTESPVHKLLAEIDVLIDGPYISSLDDNLGLRGSSNQKIYHLSDRLRGFDFENCPRKAEVFVQENRTTLIGVPPKGVLNLMDQVFKSRSLKG